MKSMIRACLGGATAALYLAFVPAAYAADSVTVPAAGVTDTEVWDEIHDSLFDGRRMLAGDGVINAHIPYRAENDLRADLGASVKVPDNTAIRNIYFIITNNPMPVSLQIRPHRPLQALAFSGTFRLNRQTPISVVVETTDGRLFHQEKIAKTSGVGACAAPPVTDVAEALKTMGQMELSVADKKADNSFVNTPGETHKELVIDISHPSHSGLQMDQVSLLFIPARYVYQLELEADNQSWLSVEGSISLSENPQLRFLLPQNAREVDVALTDSDKARSTAELQLLQ